MWIKTQIVAQGTEEKIRREEKKPPVLYRKFI